MQHSYLRQNRRHTNSNGSQYRGFFLCLSRNLARMLEVTGLAYPRLRGALCGIEPESRGVARMEKCCAPRYPV